jgi:hypothetical protein
MRAAKRNWASAGKPRHCDNETYIQYKQSKRDFRRYKRQAERQWHRENYIEITSASEVDVAEFYRIVRKQRRQSTVVTKLTYDGLAADTPASISELWADYYSNLLSPLIRHEFDDHFYKKTSERISEISNIQLPVTDQILQDTVMEGEVKNTAQETKKEEGSRTRPHYKRAHSTWREISSQTPNRTF